MLFHTRNRASLDFVLWQPSLPDEPAWESRWGRGPPGWHIECSALALRELGETIDIHGGGRDLVFPHHECETAQSEAVTGQPFVRLWFHVGLVGLGGTKMSKSLGNLVFVGDLCKEWDPAAVRLALLAHHYREDWDWVTEVDMPQAMARLNLWRSAVEGDGTDGRSPTLSSPGSAANAGVERMRRLPFVDSPSFRCALSTTIATCVAPGNCRVVTTTTRSTACSTWLLRSAPVVC